MISRHLITAVLTCTRVTFFIRWGPVGRGMLFYGIFYDLSAVGADLPVVIVVCIILPIRIGFGMSDLICNTARLIRAFIVRALLPVILAVMTVPVILISGRGICMRMCRRLSIHCVEDRPVCRSHTRLRRGLYPDLALGEVDIDCFFLRRRSVKRHACVRQFGDYVVLERHRLTRGAGDRLGVVPVGACVSSLYYERDIARCCGVLGRRNGAVRCIGAHASDLHLVCFCSFCTVRLQGRIQSEHHRVLVSRTRPDRPCRSCS